MVVIFWDLCFKLHTFSSGLSAGSVRKLQYHTITFLFVRLNISTGKIPISFDP